MPSEALVAIAVYITAVALLLKFIRWLFYYNEIAKEMKIRRRLGAVGLRYFFNRSVPVPKDEQDRRYLNEGFNIVAQAGRLETSERRYTLKRGYFPRTTSFFY